MSNRSAKGTRIEKLAADWLKAQGYLVETAPNASIRLSATRTISVRRDYFHLWDLMCVKGDTRAFAQVTVWEEVSRKRTKIVGSGFPCTFEDMILGYVGGRGRHFKILRGPEFEVERCIDLLEPPKVMQAKRRRV